MVPREELLGHGKPAELPRPRVVRVVEEAVLEAVEADAVGLADDARDESGDRLEKRQRRDFPARKDEVAERDLSVEEPRFPGPLVDPLVAAADEDETGIASRARAPAPRRAASRGARGRARAEAALPLRP